jgi:hypothetical protein
MSRKKAVESLVSEAMGLLLDGTHPYLKQLREQYELADAELTLTDAGFFVDFDLPEHADSLPLEGRFQFGDVEAEVNELDHGIGFVLFVENGRIRTLEGYTYEESIPDDMTGVTLRYVDGDERDEETLFPN